MVRNKTILKVAGFGLGVVIAAATPKLGSMALDAIINVKHKNSPPQINGFYILNSNKRFEEIDIRVGEKLPLDQVDGYDPDGDYDNEGNRILPQFDNIYFDGYSRPNIQIEETDGNKCFIPEKPGKYYAYYKINDGFDKRWKTLIINVYNPEDLLGKSYIDMLNESRMNNPNL